MSKIKIAFAGFSHETNTFSPIPTPYEAFFKKTGASNGLMMRDDLLELSGKHYNNCLSGFYEIADLEDLEVDPLVLAAATPSGPVTQDAFDRIMGQICKMIQERGPFDGIYLSLHGAMVLEGFQDGETEILKRVRQVVGDIPLVASLDLHGNITEESIVLSSAMVGYRTYPHVDKYETGWRCAKIMLYLLKGKPLFKAYRQLPFMMPVSSMSTNREPAYSLYAHLNELEKKPGVISISFMEGFPPADIPHTGPCIFTYAETQELAENTTQLLYDKILAHENEFIPDLLDVDEAVCKAISLAVNADHPVILADVQDNAGCGSTSDTIYILEALIKQGAKQAAIGLIYDPESAEIAHQAGAGSKVALALGGKLMPGQKPFEGTFMVEKLADGDFPMTGPMGKGRETNLGKMAQLRLDDVRIVVSSVRSQALDQSYFHQVGIEPSQMKILVLKSSNHYRADFEPISSAILQVAAPAAMIDDPARISYTRLRPGVRLGGNGPVYQRPA